MGENRLEPDTRCLAETSGAKFCQHRRGDSLVDPLSTGASAVTILDRLAALLRWALGRPQPALPPPRSLTRPVHAGLEVRPVHYMIDVSRSVPTVEIELLAINYLSRPLSLRDVKITRFTAGSIPVSIDNIPLGYEVTLEPQSAFLVTCTRPLADSEARVAVASKPHPGFSGSVNITARGIVRGKEVNFGATSLKIDGRLC